REGLLRGSTVEHVAELAQARDEGVPTRMLAQDQLRLPGADGLGPHDLVGVGVLQHPVLVDARLVCEGVGADDRFVGLYRNPDRQAHEATRPHELRRIDARNEAEAVAARRKRHHDLLERSVACTLADAIYGDFYLARAGADSCERIRGRKPEIVVAM